MKRVSCFFLLLSFLIMLSACRITDSFPQETSAAPSSEVTENAADQLMEEAFHRAKQTGTLVPVSLDYVVDGDTINVIYEDTSFRIRLIGVNAEESVANDTYLEQTGQENTEAGKEASDYVKTLLPKETSLYLEFDEELFDKYHRILAYVWLTEDTSALTNMLQVKLLQNSYVELMTIKPNTKYEKTFADFLPEQ